MRLLTLDIKEKNQILQCFCMVIRPHFSHLSTFLFFLFVPLFSLYFMNTFFLLNPPVKKIKNKNSYNMT